MISNHMHRLRKGLVVPACSLVAIVTVSMSQASAGVIVTTTTDANVLASSILGSGVAVVGTPTYTGVTNQSGTFTGGTDAGVGLGIPQGLILTSGNATLAPGPNSSDGAGAALGTPGDADLNAQIGGTTFNAAALEFSFQFGDGSVGGDLFFSYVFASEEYNEFIGAFNDPFALLIDGVNVAIAPDGNTVSVNNVNCGNPFSGTGPNCSSYNNNDPNDPAAAFDIQYDGFTDVLFAQVLGLAPGTHTAKFVVADASDQVLDSVVFIAGESFSNQPPNGVPEPATVLLFGGGLLGLVLASRRPRRHA